MRSLGWNGTEHTLKHESRTMKRTTSVISLWAVLLVALAACGDDPTFQLVFAIDASYQGPHAGHAIEVALVRTSDGVVVQEQTGTVSGTADPAASFTFTDQLEEGVAYDVDYWIDSNFGGGTTGVCDPTANDHQWRVTIAAVTDDVTITEAHNAANTVDVCTTFAAP